MRERRDTFRGTYLCLGSEEATQSEEFRALKGKVDLVFTSPPYFSAERYGDDEAQSSIKFDSYHNWRSGFLAPTLKTAVPPAGTVCKAGCWVMITGSMTFVTAVAVLSDRSGSKFPQTTLTMSTMFVAT